MFGRIVCTLAALVLRPVTASAQVEPHVFGGLAVAAMTREIASVGPGGGQRSWRELGYGRHRVGWTAGLTLRWSPVERVFLVGEAALTAKGFESEGMKALHAELPVLVELVPLRIGGKAVAVQGGVAWSREIACSASSVPGPTPDETTSPEPSGPRDVDCGEYRSRRHDRSAVFGAAVGPLAVLGVDVTPEIRMITGRMEASYWYRSRNRGFVFRLTVSRGAHAAR
jgi:hypothetical protein